MAEFCTAFNISPAEYKALTMSEYKAFINYANKRGKG
jgi:hypothetical protein